MEWLRSWLFSGFGWLSLGYSQLPGSPLAGYAPIGGVFAVTLAVALAAAALALAIDAFARRRDSAAGSDSQVRSSRSGSAAARWRASSGRPRRRAGRGVARPGQRRRRISSSTRAFASAPSISTPSSRPPRRGRLVVLPESAFPVFAGEVPEPVLLDLLRTVAANRDGDVLVGLFTLEAPLPGKDEPRYYNSVVTLGTASIAALPEAPSRAVR